jgi:hypothetical protein
MATDEIPPEYGRMPGWTDAQVISYNNLALDSARDVIQEWRAAPNPMQNAALKMGDLTAQEVAPYMIDRNDVEEARRLALQITGAAKTLQFALDQGAPPDLTMSIMFAAADVLISHAEAASGGVPSSQPEE